MTEAKDRPLTYCEQVSELLHNGWRLADIASLTPWSRKALFMPRDETGRLKREDPTLPEHVKVDSRGMRTVSKGRRTTLEDAYRRKNKAMGVSKERIDAGWQRFLEANPNMGRGGIKGRKKR
jgi:hypothetical protein